MVSVTTGTEASTLKGVVLKCIDMAIAIVGHQLIICRNLFPFLFLVKLFLILKQFSGLVEVFLLKLVDLIAQVLEFLSNFFKNFFSLFWFLYLLSWGRKTPSCRLLTVGLQACGTLHPGLALTHAWEVQGTPITATCQGQFSKEQFLKDAYQ